MSAEPSPGSFSKRPSEEDGRRPIRETVRESTPEPLHEHERHGEPEPEPLHEHDDAGTLTVAAVGEPGGVTWHLTRPTALLAIATAALGAGLLGGWLGWPPTAVRGLFLLAILAGMVEIAPAGWRGVVEEHSLDINFLVTVAVAGAVVLGEWSEAATVVVLFSLGEAIEGFTFARTRRSIQALMAMAPETACLKLPDGREVEQRVEEVPVGSVVVVRPGDRIPLDGVVIEGESAVDEAPITGEAVPVDKRPGDQVYAGTINRAGYLEIRTTKPFAENTLARIIHLVERAQSERAPSQRFVERFARIYTPAVVAGAVLLAAVPPLAFGQPFVPWFNRALVLLLVACPCALVVSTPVSVVAAIGNASRNGVLIKGGQYLEQAGTVRVVALDKTGTLTRGLPEVQRVLPLNGLTEHQLLRLAAAAEVRSEHPLAAAVVRAARRSGVADLPPVAQFQSTAGGGIVATVDGITLAIGKPAWIEAIGVVLEPARALLDELAAAGQTPVVVARLAGGAPADAGLMAQPAASGAGRAGPAPEVGIAAPASGLAGMHRGELLGVLAIADELRPGAAQAIAALRRNGLQRVVLLTGDSAATTRAIAQQLGLSPQDVYADLLPEEKARIVRELVRRHRNVAMVGDGVNDAPALAAATVGIAMGTAGSDVALETADVALAADDLTKLPWVLDLSRRAARTIKVNVALALGIKLLVLILAALGLANLWLAIAADTGASVLVTLNGMRLLGRISQPAMADMAALRRRYGLTAEDEHAGHAHGRH
jgi:Cd2+/Zn2+-exporting ATPase